MKYTYDECYNIAKKYTIKGEFRTNEPKLYATATKNGWLKDYFWLCNKKKYTKEYCFSVAEKYDSYNLFRDNEYKVFSASKRNGWINDYAWLKKEKTDYYDFCYKEAKKYNTLKDFRKNGRSAYVLALQCGYLDDFAWLERTNKKSEYKWSLKENAIKFSHENCLEISKQYKTVRELKEGNPTCYRKCIRKKWIDECTWLVDDRMKPIMLNQDINYDYCYNLAKKYGCKTEFSNEHPTIYDKALKNGWVKDYTWFKGVERLKNKNFCVYSYECVKEKTVYVGLTNDIKRRHRQHENKVPHTDHYDRIKEFFISVGMDLPMYEILSEGLTAEKAQFYEHFWIEQYKNNGWVILNKAETGKNKSSLGGFVNKWTHDVCIEIAKKYATKSDFLKNDNQAYQACCRNGWIEELCWMERRTNKARKIFEIDENGLIVKSFESLRQVKREYGFSREKVENIVKKQKKLENGHFFKEK